MTRPRLLGKAGGDRLRATRMHIPSLARRLAPSALVLALAACASHAPPRQEAPRSAVNYYVRLAQAGVDRFDVSVALDEVRRDSLDFVLPVWTPGELEPAVDGSAIENFSVRDGRGRPITTRRLGPTRWRIYPVDTSYLTVGYQVVPAAAAGPLPFRPRLGLHSGYALGSMLFGHLEGHEGRPVTVSFDIPSRWSVRTPLDPTGATRFSGRSFDVLPGTPFVLGDRLREYKLFVQGRPHEIVVLGEPPGFAPDSLIALVGETIDHGTRFYGAPAYARYLFAIEFLTAGAPGFGATGQATGSAYFLPPIDSRRVRESGLGTVLLHQYLHAWYPGSFGPAPLQRPVYSAPPQVPERWLIEGAAEYYARLLPARYQSGGREGFYDSMGELLTLWRELGGGPRVDVAALGAGSDERDRARFVAGGALAAFILDIAIRGDTRGERGLEHVLYYLQRATSGSGYEPGYVWSDVGAALGIPASALGPLVGPGGGVLSIEAGLARAGLRLVQTRDRSRSLGARLHVDDAGRFVVRDVQPGGTAGSAGLRDGDRLLKINATPVAPGEAVATRYALANYIREARPGATVRFEVLRDGQPQERVGSVRESAIERVRIEELSGSSASALLVRSSLFRATTAVPSR